jgi:uridine phosphorylase
MESATVLVLSALKGLRAGVLLLCVDEFGAGEIKAVEGSHMDRLLAVAVNAIRRLAALDGGAS